MYKIKLIKSNTVHEVKDINKDIDGRIVYQLVDITKPIYTTDIEEIYENDILVKSKTKKHDEKSEIEKGEIQNPDGSIDRFPGKEQLKKPKKLNKALAEKWSLLKADLSHSSAFSSLLNEDKPQTEPSEEKKPQDEQDASQQEMPPQEAPEQQEPEQQDAPEQDQQDEQPEQYDEEKAKDLLRKEGYSESEIAYIIHHQVPAQASPEELKHAEAAQDLNHQQAKHGQEISQDEDHHDVDINHKKRMTDMEHEYAKREKEMKLKYLEEELKHKLDNIKKKGKS
jgi:hypothetical protein